MGRLSKAECDARDELPWKHCIYGLLEVDVTVARQFIEEHEARTGEHLSFTGYLVFCLARAVDEDKSVQAYLKGRKHLVVFDDVDVALPVERRMGGARAPMVHVIRGANHKTFLEIHQEIRSVQATPRCRRVKGLRHGFCSSCGDRGHCPSCVVDGKIEPREILSLTVAFDHDVVDAAPARWFGWFDRSERRKSR